VKRTLIAAVLAMGIHAVLLGAECSRLKQISAKRPIPRVVTMTLTARQTRSPTRNTVVNVPDIPLKTRVRSTTVKKKLKTKIQKPKSPKTHKAVLQPPKKDLPAAAEKTVEPLEPLAGDEPEVPETASTTASTPADQSKQDASTVQISREARPLYRINPAPDYPQSARRRGYQGNVILEVLIDRNGNVGDLRVFQSSGYAILDRAAMDSVKEWAFVPAVRGSETVEMWVRVPIRFELK
jgi:TonB family protein